VRDIVDITANAKSDVTVTHIIAIISQSTNETVTVSVAELVYYHAVSVDARISFYGIFRYYH